MAIGTYRCRLCRQLFPRTNPRGRLPRACPEHRKLVKSLNDRKRRRQSQRVYPPCCVAATGRVCPQHTQFRRFKYHWLHQVISDNDSEFLSSITESGQLDGFHIV